MLHDQYTKLLESIGNVETPKVAPQREHVYHLYVIRTDWRDQLKSHLAAAGISTVLNYPKALPFYPAYDYLHHDTERFPSGLWQPVPHIVTADLSRDF